MGFPLTGATHTRLTRSNPREDPYPRVELLDGVE
jgi:hypothetical protein